MCKVCIDLSYYMCRNCVSRLNLTETGQSILHTIIYDLLREITVQVNGFKKHFKELRITPVILAELDELNFESRGTYIFLDALETNLNFIELNTNIKEIVSIKNLAYGLKDLRRLIIFFAEINTSLLEHVAADLTELKLSVKELIFLIVPYLSIRSTYFNVLKELRTIDVCKWPAVITI
ncbi:hypothetical protein LDVICp112 [lymphocystis disease virus-China]|uniref:Uncharacterized protein n=2 Tax=Lymphocystis disease virus 2 TaxID=159183 RepID=A0A6F8X2I6_9VIRU|nr:hypothetical protein LDVICp112 [lymphocystis disease virus-China]AAU10957.1 hypothetical protein [lymphocystis disease virus-China]BCB67476.1 hypothetical protein [Lymphocystis disease virus 2]